VGLLAQLGARMINEVSNKMFAEFTTNFKARLQQERPQQSSSQTPPSTGSGDEPRPIKALPLVASVLGESIGRFFRRIFKGSSS
jgi:hypothetical protein